jgi:endonuclease YncB( thermonuclease family)
MRKGAMMATRRVGRCLLIGLGLLAVWPGLASSALADITCGSFAFQEDAQIVVDTQAGEDPYSLDPVGIPVGVACHGLPSIAEGAAVEPAVGSFPVAQLPTDMVETTVDSALAAAFISVEEAGDIEDDMSGPFVTLLGIAVPEWGPKVKNQQCFGEEAENFVRSVLPEGTTIYLEKDPLYHRRDKYPSAPEEDVADLSEDARYVENVYPRYVWLEQADGTYELLNQWMVREGYAVAAPYPPNQRYNVSIKYAGDLRQARQEAIANSAGLWGACAVP